MSTVTRPLRYSFAIFDLDGTLADTLPLIYLAFNDAVQPVLQRSLPDDEIRGMFGPPDTAILRSIIPENHAEEAISRYMERYRRDHTALVTLYDGIRQIFDDAVLQEMKLAVVTGKSRVTAIFTLEQLGVLDLFDVVYGGDDVERQKPDPQAVFAALAELGASPGESGVMIGDSAADVMAGKAAGLATIGVLWGNPDHEELARSEPDVVCATMDQLREALGLHRDSAIT